MAYSNFTLSEVLETFDSESYGAESREKVLGILQQIVDFF